MARFQLASNLYIQPSPGGVYHAFSSALESPARRLIRSLLSEEISPELSLEGLSRWTGLGDEDQAMALLHHAQGVRWVQGFQQPLHCSTETIEVRVPGLLARLSSQGKCLLADSHGFYLASSGIHHEVAEELSALSAELSNIHERRSGLLLNNMGLDSSAWSVVDAGGGSRLGFWPIYIDQSRFVLVIQGLPRFNQPEFVDLIWMLNLRFGRTVKNQVYGLSVAGSW
jgi:hypothetical protein